MNHYYFIYIILKTLTLYPPFYHEPTFESELDREKRLAPVAEMIYAASEIRPKEVSRISMISALIGLGEHESKFAKYIGEGKCLDGPAGMRCDLDRNGIPRARTYWQHWRVSCPKAWEMEPGSKEELRAAAFCTAGKLTGAYYRCMNRNDNVWAGAFSGFRASSCDWGPADERVKTMNYVRLKLTKYTLEIKYLDE